MSAKIPEISKLDKHHIRGLRICFKVQGKINDDELFTLGNISNLENRRKVHLRNYMFRNKNKCAPIEDDVILTRSNSGPTFNVIKPNCEYFKRNVYYNGAVEWNSLDADIRNLPDIHKFKRMQKSWFLHTYLE